MVVLPALISILIHSGVLHTKRSGVVMVDLVLSSEQRQIVDSVGEYLSARAPLARLRPGAGNGCDAGLWPSMGKLGWFMLGLPEDEGGGGMSVVEEALVFRRLGRHVFSPNVLASLIGARVASAAGVADMARAIASGSERVALANALSIPSLDGRVAGRFHLFDAEDAQWVLVVTEAGDAALLERADLDRVHRGVSAVDGMTIDTAIIDALPAVTTSGREFGAHIVLRLLAAAMLVGVCEAARDMATEYAKIRHQFGQPIGAFQAIKHKCADMALRAEAAGALVSFASICVATGREDASFQATAAKLLSGRSALLGARETIQVHGAIGFTVECDAHHLLKRAHVYDHIAGSSRRQQQLLLAEPAPAEEHAG
jgi:alkylation response protein AidB-like acyl-CoA dehydrogenase